MVVSEVVRTPDDLTVEWLTDSVGAAVESFETERIGTGQMSQNHRVRLSGDGVPASVVIKVAARVRARWQRMYSSSANR